VSYESSLNNRLELAISSEDAKVWGDFSAMIKRIEPDIATELRYLKSYLFSDAARRELYSVHSSHMQRYFSSLSNGDFLNSSDRELIKIFSFFCTSDDRWTKVLFSERFGYNLRRGFKGMSLAE